MSWDAVILAGGRGSRLGGADKPALLVDGRSLLDRALAATAGARVRVVVGPPRPGAVPDDVLVVREEPPFGGPVAALAAGLAALPRGVELVAVVAADLLEVEAALPRVLEATRGSDADGWLAVDPAGRDQPLLAVHRRRSLEAALAALAAGRGMLGGAALRTLLHPLRCERVPLPADLCADVDDADDALRAGVVPHALPLESR
jgi:molybdopterin-guanine dinucleotide biosynthesis protein A